MTVVDTNVVVALMVQSQWTDAARALLAHDSDWRSEPVLLVELTNVLATLQRLSRLEAAVAERILAEAESLLNSGFVTAPHRAVLQLAQTHSVSAYDARFLAVAQQLGSPLITEDAKLRAAAPALTRSLAEALATR